MGGLTDRLLKIQDGSGHARSGMNTLKKGGTFHFGGIFGGIIQAITVASPLNTRPVANSTVPLGRTIGISPAFTLGSGWLKTEPFR